MEETKKQTAINELAKITNEIGVTNAIRAIERETGHKPARSAIYDALNGRGKEGSIILLTYALKNAVAKLNS